MTLEAASALVQGLAGIDPRLVLAAGLFFETLLYELYSRPIVAILADLLDLCLGHEGAEHAAALGNRKTKALEEIDTVLSSHTSVDQWVLVVGLVTFRFCEPLLAVHLVGFDTDQVSNFFAGEILSHPLVDDFALELHTANMGATSHYRDNA